MNNKTQTESSVNNNSPLDPANEIIQGPTHTTTQVMQGDMDVAMANAEKYFSYLDKLRKLALNVTSPEDWVDESGKPYLQWTGSSKVAGAFGISYESPTFEKEVIKDEIGEYVNFHCSGIVIFNNRSMPEVGIGSSRDDFFGKRNKKDAQGNPIKGPNGKNEKYWLPVSEIDLNNVKKKAMTNWLNRGIKSMLGLSFSWEQIEQITQGRITRSTCGGKVKFQKGAASNPVGDPNFQKKKAEIGKWILEMNDKDKQKAGDDLERRTSFKGKDDKMVPGKRTIQYLKEGQVNFMYDKVKAEYEAWSKANPPVPEVNTNTPLNISTEVEQ